MEDINDNYKLVGTMVLNSSVEMQRRTIVWEELSSQAKPRGTLNLELAGADVGVRRELENMALTGILCKYIEQTCLASLFIHLISIQTYSSCIDDFYSLPTTINTHKESS